MKSRTLPPFTAEALVVGGSFRLSAGQGPNYKATKINRYVTTGKPKRTMLEVIAEGLSAPLILELHTPLFHAK